MTKLPYNLDEHGVTSRRIATNGIELNVFEAGEGPLILLLHGFPESWIVWGPQVPMLLKKGYKVAMPEMRGYGESDAPIDKSAYNTVELAADVAGLIDAYGEEEAIVVGHDWGCNVAWHTAWLHPDKVKAVGGLSVPWFGRGDQPMIETFKQQFGDNYFYILDFQNDATTALLNEDKYKSINLVLRGDTDIVNQGTEDANFLERITLDEAKNNFVSDELVEYIAGSYESNGFEGPLNWYRNTALTFKLTEGKSDIIQPPAMYLTGTREWTLEYIEKTGFDMTELFADLRINESTEAGHWLSQEVPEWVNEQLSKFLDTLK